MKLPFTNISDRVFLLIVWLLLATAVGATFYIYIVRMDYRFILEAPCDSTTQSCFVRDCSVEECGEDIPSEYRLLSVAAKDYSECTDQGCSLECDNGTVDCIELFCGESEEDVCTQ